MIVTAVTSKIPAAAVNIQAAGVFDWVDEKTSAAQGTIQGLLIVVGLIVGLIIAWRSKSVGGVLMGIVVGALIAGLPALIQFFSGMVGEETTAASGSHMITYSQALINSRA